METIGIEISGGNNYLDSEGRLREDFLEVLEKYVREGGSILVLYFEECPDDAEKKIKPLKDEYEICVLKKTWILIAPSGYENLEGSGMGIVESNLSRTPARSFAELLS